MFILTKNSGIFYKPSIMTSCSNNNNMNNNNKSNINSLIILKEQKEQKYNTPAWTRRFFERSKDDFYFHNLPCNETLVSLSAKHKNKNENFAVVLCKNVYYLGYFINKWISTQLRFTGYLNWIHPWFVIRHRYFYRGY